MRVVGWNYNALYTISCINNEVFTLSKLKNNIIDNKVLGIKSYFSLILTYGIIATGLTMFASKNNQEQVFSTLTLFPILGQILHFYIDGLIWKFRDKNIREINLSYLLK